MKKSFYTILMLALALSGCSSKENTEKINAFWTQQMVNVLKQKWNMSEIQARMMIASTQMKRNSATIHLNKETALFPFMKSPAEPMQQPLPKTKGAPPINLAPNQAVPQPKTPPQEILMEVTVDDPNALFANSPASAQDQAVIKAKLDSTLETNQKTLQDVQKMFGNQVRDQALLMITKQEQSLKAMAASAPTAQIYAARSDRLSAGVNQRLMELFQKNSKSIKRSK